MRLLQSPSIHRLHPGFWACLILVASLASCKSRPRSAQNESLAPRECISLLPDSLKANPFGDRRGFNLDPEQVNQLITESEATVKGETWRVIDADSSWVLRLERSGSDEGLYYDILPWAEGRKSWVLILQGLGDHCCHFSRLALYEVIGGKLIDRTQTGLPQLTWGDFFSAETLAEAKLEPIRRNRYPVMINLSGRPPQLEVNLVAEYLSVNFDEAVGEKLLAAYPSAPLVLEWKDGAFQRKR